MSPNTAIWDAHARADRPCQRGCGDASPTPEQLRRSARVHKRAIEVFGSPIGAGVWYHSPNERTCGRWISPRALSCESDEACWRVLAELDRIAPIFQYRQRPARRVQ